MARRRGQVALYLLMTIVVLCFLALMNVDIFLSVRAKNRIQNAGDAAAIAAARHQGRVLNEIGRLNIERLIAAALDDTNRCDELLVEQRRLALLAPVDGLREADDAARRNGREPRDEFSAILREHAEIVRTVYAGGGQPGDPYPEPYPGAWLEYAAAIENAIVDGLAAGPDNLEFYYAQGGHLLLTRDFYSAIAGRNWCWFHFNAESTLKSYTGYEDWGPLPVRQQNSFENSEVFSLHVQSRKVCVLDVFKPREILALLDNYKQDEGQSDDAWRCDPCEIVYSVITNSALLRDKSMPWFFLKDDYWREWTEISAERGFPVLGSIKSEYDVRGCAAILRCEDDVESYAVDGSANLTWSAAAKPFGRLIDLKGDPVPATALKGFLVPCFTDVRLVPLDSVGGQNLATADAGWVNHVRHHLWAYMTYGAIGLNSRCWYCDQLRRWELDSFRLAGVEWLKFNGGTCRRSTGGGIGGGGGGIGGGTSHGH